jgi:hypothetical protein
MRFFVLFSALALFLLPVHRCLFISKLLLVSKPYSLLKRCNILKMSDWPSDTSSDESELTTTSSPTAIKDFFLSSQISFSTRVEINENIIKVSDN